MTLLLLLLFVLAWIVLILPKQRELRRHNALVASLEVGDEVMSGAGIYGTITGIDGDVVWLEIAPDIEIKVAKRAVASKVAEPASDDDDDDDDEVEVEVEVDDDLEAADGSDDVVDVTDVRAENELEVSDGSALRPRGTDVDGVIAPPADDDARPDGRG